MGVNPWPSRYWLDALTTEIQETPGEQGHILGSEHFSIIYTLSKSTIHLSIIELQSQHITWSWMMSWFCKSRQVSVIQSEYSDLGADNGITLKEIYISHYIKRIKSRTRLLYRWITLSTRAWFVLLTLIHWIAIYQWTESYPAFEQLGSKHWWDLIWF